MLLYMLYGDSRAGESFAMYIKAKIGGGEMSAGRRP